MATPYVHNKRRRVSRVSNRSYVPVRSVDTPAQDLLDNDGQEQRQDFWSDASFFAVDVAPIDDILNGQVPPGTLSNGSLNPKATSRPVLSWEPSNGGLPRSDLTFSEEFDSSSQGWLRAQFPELFPSVPSIENRIVDLSITNPFLEGCEARHASLKPNQAIPEDGAVNGYIKFRIRFSKDDAESQPRTQHSIFGQQPLGVHHRKHHLIPEEHVPCLPPDFGKGIKLDNMDSKLMKFYLNAFCAGRTLLPMTNFWIHNIAPIADKNQCVLHALLALAAAYVLDYKPIPELLARANRHYKLAVELLGKALQNPASHKVGKDDAVIGALILLLSNDIVNWELRKDKDHQQRWYEGARVAKQILDSSDPGYRYYNPGNVQTSTARTFNGNWVAHIDIIAQPVSRLNFNESDSTYGWLLEGSEREVRRIHGVTGLSSKLLHIYAQITRFAARIHQSPTSTILPIGALKLEERLTNFRQWSDLSPGYATTKELLDSCEFEDGLVTSPAKVTDLTGEAWVAAAQIYLQCRFFRRPRSHPKVRQPVDVLAKCIKWMPCAGPLFTSQSPFFPIFILGIVAYQEEDRQVVTNWFEAVLKGAGCRSSVPPVWENLKDLWKWMDEDLEEDTPDFDGPIALRTAWWEQMVERLLSTAGQLSLA